MNVHQLLYMSKMTDGLDSGDLKLILEESRLYNAAHGITGVLLIRNGLVLHLIEGERTAVSKLFESVIRTDCRHEHIVTILDIKKNDRAFNKSVGMCLELSRLSPNMVNEMLSWNLLIINGAVIDNNFILYILDRFRTVQRQCLRKTPA